jgi:hypothetical protein
MVVLHGQSSRPNIWSCHIELSKQPTPILPFEQWFNFDAEVPPVYVYRLDKYGQYKLVSSLLFILYLVYHMLHYALFWCNH